MTILDLKSIGSLAIMFVIDLVDVGRIETAISCFFVLAYNLHRYIDYLRAKNKSKTENLGAIAGPKKTVSPYVFIFIFLLILFAMSLLMSCGSAKVVEVKDVKSEVNTAEVTELIKQSQINREINDRFAFEFPKLQTGDRECDSISNVLLLQALRSIHTEKQSGDNAYQFKYNDLTKQLELLVKVSETQNQRIDSINGKTKTVYKTEYRQKPVRLPLRWYEKMFVVIGAVSLLCVLIYILMKITKKSSI